MSGFWQGRRVLVTGHTGFKGVWLSLWLEQLGAKVIGLSLPPHTSPSLYSLVGPWPNQEREFVDVRDARAVTKAVADAQPQIVFHLAAQALVRPSYQDPITTFATNVMGTLHILGAIRHVPGIEAAVVVTTDKVYENLQLGQPFVEQDRLGGKDPYSSSKACAELVTQSFRDSFLSDDRAPRVATARAGNVVGGGDWSVDRLVPDIVRAHTAGHKVKLRYPDAVRPWQHVLEPLHGYLTLGQLLIESPKIAPKAVNFGPDPGGFLSVAEVVEMVSQAFGGSPGWEQMSGAHPAEADTLTLSSEHARQTLGWRSKLTMLETIDWTAQWYRDLAGGGDARQLTLSQIYLYQSLCS